MPREATSKRNKATKYGRRKTEISQLRDIADNAKKTGLVLFLGAGVTATLVPTWGRLLDGLLQDALEWRLGVDGNPSDLKNLIGWATSSELLPYQKAALVKRFFGSQYLTRLRQALYAGRGDSGSSGLLNAVVQLCAHEAIIAIVTYNFDDLLIRRLHATNTRRVRVVHGPQDSAFQWVPRNAENRSRPFLPVFHIHGYIPHGERPPTESASALVFSQDEYFQNMLTPFSWQTTTQLHFLRNYTTLFLGTSLSDVNMARMLHHAQASGPQLPNYAVYAAQDFFSIKCPKKGQDLSPSQKSQVRMRATVLRDLGVELVYAGLKWEQVTTAIEDLHSYL